MQPTEVLRLLNRSGPKNRKKKSGLVLGNLERRRRWESFSRVRDPGVSSLVVVVKARLLKEQVVKRVMVREKIELIEQDDDDEGE